MGSDEDVCRCSSSASNWYLPLPQSPLVAGQAPFAVLSKANASRPNPHSIIIKTTLHLARPPRLAHSLLARCLSFRTSVVVRCWPPYFE